MKILVVDDNEDITNSFGILFSAFGYTVEIANDGNAACERASAFQPEAALVDIRMPGKHGYEVAAFLKTLGSVKSGCLIGMTGDGGPDAQNRAKAAGFDYLLLKPTSIDVVMGLLEKTGQNP